MSRKTQNLNVSILCGGPSLERGISLNSARSVCDHLHSDRIKVTPIYFDHHKKAYKISRSQLYSNTPSDFDFKLQSTAKPLNKNSLFKLLKSNDLVFPVMHGEFGEDGQIQKILESQNIPFIGSDYQACRNCFDKYRANEYIKNLGFYTMPSIPLKIHEASKNKAKLLKFFKENKISRAIVKPATGGSSIGVFSVSTVEQAIEAAQKIFSKRMDTKVVVEPFCNGIEFTVIILQNRFGLPVAIMPTEMEIDYSKHQTFDFRKKYLPTRQVKYHCPPRFAESTIEKIQIQSEQLFRALGMQDFARFDGWLLDDGNIWFSDFNPISGMEQNSFLFMQSSQIGFSHRDLLEFIVKRACQRHNLEFPKKEKSKENKRKRINVIFGGKTAERQVSVMSGTNVWLKLRNSKKYDPYPYLLDLDDETVWELPYSKTINHTVEEISENCRAARLAEERINPLRRRVIEKLSITPDEISEEIFIPRKVTLKEFIKESEFVFIGLHGGIGENGKIQKMLENAGKKFNGSGSAASEICMDKYTTGQVLKNLEKQGIHIPQKIAKKTTKLTKFTTQQIKRLWKDLKNQLSSKEIIVKPRSDGCSAGIVKLTTSNDLFIYLGLIKRNVENIPKGTFKDQYGIIEMPTTIPKELIFEQFISTDKVKVIKNELKWETVSGWIEVTIGVLGKENQMKAMNPSQTVATGHVLSLEEKFQGGTGINITPPPQPFVSKKAIKAAKERMELIAKKLGISGYARIDSFMNVKNGELMIIEANSTPGLTPSTVIFHQALVEKEMMYPTKFLEKIIENA
ncbi:hypothetical protein ACFL21_04430 [Patescibacteria group bacterium]